MMKTNLVFLCGFPSSGTDLLKNVMNAHPDVSINGEFPFLPLFARTHGYGATVTAAERDGAIEALRRIDVYGNLENPTFEIDRARSEYSLAEIYAGMLTDKPCRWKGNKTPQNTEHIEALRLLFPEAKFILIARDVRDVALSWWNKWGKHKMLCAHKWNARMLKGARSLKELDPKDCLVIKYEALLDNLENTARSICDFLDIEYHDSMAEFHKRVDRILDGKLNYGKALIKENSNKWVSGLSPREVRRIEEVAFDALQAFDYPIARASRSRPLGTWEKYWGYAWDVCATAIVGNRAVEKNTLRDRWNIISFEFRKLFSRLLRRNPARSPLRGLDH